VTEQVGAAGRATSSALRDALDQVKASMAARERELVETLLVTPEAGDAGAVFGRRSRDAGSRDRDASPWAQDATRTGGDSPRTDAASQARPTGRVDDEDPLYDF
jgi:hypothetical protein